MKKSANKRKPPLGWEAHIELTEALGQSEAFLDFQERLSRVAPVNRPVLLVGERGTGKELAALRIHFLSNRWQGPLVTLNCAALAASLLESELFGYDKGAFTGAVQGRAGRFETAEDGTLFLDEVGSIPMEVQEKILRVVEYSKFERVGSSKSIEVDVRIVAATNADLVSLAESGRFKRDLLDRLSFEVLFVPPLRERRGDIALLANHFATRIAFELGWETIPQFSGKAVAALESYSWPGNIRELKNVVERAVYRSDSHEIAAIVFDPFTSPYERRQPNVHQKEGMVASEISLKDNILDKPLKDAVWELKIHMLEKALKEAKYNQKKAAEILGLTYHQFRGLYRQYRKSVV